jgi:prolyl oligopeptidase
MTGVTEADLAALLVPAQRFFADRAALRARFHTRMRTLWSVPYRGLPWWRAGTWFQLRRDGAAEQDVLWAGRGLPADDRVVLDPATLDGEVVVDLTVSPDGRHVAYAAAQPGSEWHVWRVRDTRSGTDLPGHSRPARFSGAAWLPDGSGLRYTGAIGPRSGPTGLLCHRPGTVDDEVLYTAPDAGWAFDPVIDAGPGVLLVQAHAGDGTGLRVLVGDRGRWRDITPDETHEWRLVGHHGDRILLLRDGRTVEAVAVPASGRPTGPTRTVAAAATSIEYATVVGEHLVLVEHTTAGHRLRALHLPTGAHRPADLPHLGSIDAVRAAEHPGALLVSYMSYASPTATYRVELSTGRTRLVDPSTLAEHCARFDTVVREVPTADGEPVPLYVVGHRGLIDGTGFRRPAPMVLSVYGGFGQAERPTFRWVWLAWLEAGGAVAFGGVRGGTDRGVRWHRAATGTGKQRTFDDVVACARYLVDEGFARPPGPVVHGTSNGGLSAAASFMQHPDRFAGLAVESALLDMVRHEELDPHGFWTDEFGSATDPAISAALHAYSPVEAVRAGAAYPPVFVSLGAADELVNPAHSYRFAQRLRRLAPATPVVLRADPDGGHGRSDTIGSICAARGDLLTFLSATLDPHGGRSAATHE